METAFVSGSFRRLLSSSGCGRKLEWHRHDTMQRLTAASLATLLVMSSCPSWAFPEKDGSDDWRLSLAVALRSHMPYRTVLAPLFACGSRHGHDDLTTIRAFQTFFSSHGLPTASPRVDVCTNGSLEADTNTIRHYGQLALGIASLKQCMLRDFIRKYGCDIPTKAGMAYWKIQTWLLFLDDRVQEDLDVMFKGLNVYFNCKLTIVRRDGTLTEVYRVWSEAPLSQVPLGRWQHNRLVWTAGSRYVRGADLAGVTLSCSTIHSQTLTTTKQVNGSLIVCGHLAKFWNILEQRMNFRTNCSLIETGEEEDLAYHVIRKNIDVGLAVLPITGTGWGTSVSVPLKLTRIVLVMRTPSGQPLRWYGFLQPFCARLWAALLCTLALVFLAVHCCSRCVPVQDAGFVLVAALLQQGHDRPPRQWWFRVLVVTVHLTATVVAAGYSASLISSLTSGQDRLPDAEELVGSGRFHLHMVDGSKEMLTLQESRTRLLRLLNSCPQSVHRSYRGTLAHLCRLGPGHLTLMQSDQVQLHEPSLPCHLSTLPGFSLRVGLVIPLRKNFPYLQLLNFNINRLRERGLLTRVSRARTQWPVPAWPRRQRPAYESVGAATALPLLCGLAVLTLAAVATLLAERCCCWAAAATHHTYSSSRLAAGAKPRQLAVRAH